MGGSGVNGAVAVRISVVIPTRDRPDLVPHAVASALRALPDDHAEIVVVDDGSRIPVQESLVALTDPRLRIVTNPGPHGPGHARNLGVTVARGDVILFLDDDDLLRDGYPAAVLDLAEGADAPDYGYCAILGFVTGREPVPLPRFDDRQGEAVASLSPRRRLGGLGCGFWVRRNLFAKAGAIDTQLLVNEDTDFSLRLLGLSARGFRFSAAGVLVRQHDRSQPLVANQTRRHGPERRAEWFGIILKRHATYLSDHPDLRQHLQKRRLSMLAKAGHDREARAIICAAPRLTERAKLGLHYLAVRIGGLFRS